MSNQRHPLSDQDLEQLSAYMDGALSVSEKNALETRLNADPTLRAELEALRQVAQAAASLPTLKAPRNFTITHEMLGITPRKPAKLLFFPTTAAFSAMSAVASILFFVIGVSLLSNTLSSTPTPPIMSANEIVLAPTNTGETETQTTFSIEESVESSAGGSGTADYEQADSEIREREPDDALYPAPIGSAAGILSTPAPPEAYLADEGISALRAAASPEVTDEAIPFLMQLPAMGSMPEEPFDETEEGIVADTALMESAVMFDATPEITPETTLEMTAQAPVEAVAEVMPPPDVSQTDTQNIGGVILIGVAALAFGIAILTTVIRLRNR